MRRKHEQQARQRIRLEEGRAVARAHYLRDSDSDTEVSDQAEGYVASGSSDAEDADIVDIYGGDDLGHEDDGGINGENSERESLDPDHNGDIGDENSERESLDSGSAVEASDVSDDEEYDVQQPLHFENEQERGDVLVEVIRHWASSPGVLSMSKLDELLQGINPLYPQIPKSYKTLLQTPKGLDITQDDNGNLMWYKGIRANLDAMLLLEYVEKFGVIKIDINMDGLPLYKGSEKKFWPILGYLVHTKNPPFIIGLFYGIGDPAIDFYLSEYVEEVALLLENGYDFNDKSYPFLIGNYILDAPARSLVKCCIGHSGYCACEKCTVVGAWDEGRVTFLQLDAELRTDESYRNQDQAYHHSGVSPLADERVLTGMISQFRLDSMHLCYCGVVKRLFTAWLKWPGHFHLHWESVSNISDILESLVESCPLDFNRKPQTFSKCLKYKATELRRIALYDGILAFRNDVHKSVYKNWLLLHVALYILSSPVLVKTMCQYASHLLRVCINHSATVYERKFVVYNVHSLAHLGEECEENGPLDTFSAFRYENQLKTIKETLKSCYKALHQIAYRDAERFKDKEVKLKSDDKEIHLSRPCKNKRNHFRRADVDGVMFQVDGRNACFQTDQRDVAILQDIVVRGNVVYFVGNTFAMKEDFYTYPLPSSVLGIYKVSNLRNDKKYFNLDDVKAKCWLMPDGPSHVCIPLLHTVEALL